MVLETTCASGEDVDSVYDNYEVHFIVTQGIRDRKNA